MKKILTLIFTLTSSVTMANCNVHVSVYDLVIGGKDPEKFIQKKLERKGYLVVDEVADANFSLDLNRSTGAYMEPPGLFVPQPDDLTGSFTNLETNESFEISEYRDVFLLDLRAGQSFRKNIRRALRKLPNCN